MAPTTMPAATRLHKTSEGAAPIVASFLGGEHGQAERTVAGPITYVDSSDPPVLTIHGTADTPVPPDQAERFDAAMDKADADHEFLLLEKQGHGPAARRSGRCTRSLTST